MEKLAKILEGSQYSESDLEFVIKYLDKSDISPQLAMRRIKAFDKLQEKLDKESNTKDELKELKEGTGRKDEEIKDLSEDLSIVEEKKKELETQNELLVGEVEQLREQLNMLQEMHMAEDKDKSKGIPLELIENIRSQFKILTNKNDKLKPVIDSILEALPKLIDENTFSIDIDKTLLNFDKMLQKEIKQSVDKEVSKTIEEAKVKLEETKTKLEEEYKIKLENELKSRPIEKIKVKEKVKTNETSQTKKDIKPTKKVKLNTDVIVDDKTHDVLKLFIEFIGEAQSDEEFKKTVNAICETDEAYVHIGGIGISQIYSYATKKLDKRESLVKLFKSWIKKGIPK